MTMERRKMLMIYGARIVLSPGAKGMNGAEDLAKKIVEENPDKYFMPNQFTNRYNVLAHYDTTAEEIWKDTKGRVTHFVVGIGTSGTLMGVAKKLREYNPNIKVIAVEPETTTPIQGLKNLQIQYVPSIFEKKEVDERHYVNLQTAEDTASPCTRRSNPLRSKHWSNIACSAREGKELEQWRDSRDGSGWRREVPHHAALRRG
jgi:cysteine synthase